MAVDCGSPVDDLRGNQSNPGQIRICYTFLSCTTAMRLDRGVVLIVAATLTTHVSSLYCYSTAIARVPAIGSRRPDVDKSPATSTLSQALMHLAERLDEPSKDGRIFAALLAAAGLLVVLHTHEYILWHAGVNSKHSTSDSD